MYIDFIHKNDLYKTSENFNIESHSYSYIVKQS